MNGPTKAVCFNILDGFGAFCWTGDEASSGRETRVNGRFWAGLVGGVEIFGREGKEGKGWKLGRVG